MGAGCRGLQRHRLAVELCRQDLPRHLAPHDLVVVPRPAAVPWCSYISCVLASQVLKGTLELAVLAILRTEDCYGIEVFRRLETAGIHGVLPRAVYGTLNRLAYDGCLTTYDVPEQSGKPRYYRITSRGRARLAELTVTWREFSGAMERLLG